MILKARFAGCDLLHNNTVIQAVNAVNTGQVSFCKFLTTNDLGLTGSHQQGIYVPLDAWSLLFQRPGVKGEFLEKAVTVRWNNDIETSSCFKYYGQKTRNEYRITRFGRGFLYRDPEYCGDLLVLVKVEEAFYEAYIISNDENIDYFFDALGLSPADANSLIHIRERPRGTLEEIIEHDFIEFLHEALKRFPTTAEMSQTARLICERLNGVRENARTKPDEELLRWVDTEYHLFRKIEDEYYGDKISVHFRTIDDFLKLASEVMNRRKSRAGWSLEHHLSAAFRYNDLTFDSGKTTEGKKKPDFIFPGIDAYHNPAYDPGRLVFLGAKTTCKDRWRQILNEADRIETKYLFTLQRGISSNQLQEMKRASVFLVVPSPYKTDFPKEQRDELVSLKDFIQITRSKIVSSA